jgi:hypothetical protein
MPIRLVGGLVLAAFVFADPAVGSFKLAPAPSVYGAYRNDSFNSWGGSLIHVPEDKEWPFHMYVSAFVQNCGLHAWETNSEIAHLVSKSPEQPFVYADTALPPWHHGVGVARAPDGTFLMFTMGTTNTSWVVPCDSSGKPAWPSHQNSTGFHVRAHWSRSPYGPWTAIKNADDGSEVLWTAVNPDPSPW